MASEHVTIAQTSAGAHGRATPGEPVEVPIDALRDGRGLITGAPDAGIDDAAAVLADRLLAAGQSVLLVDGDGSHRDLAREHGVRVAGDDADSDVRLSRGNADRIATITGENDESVVIDCSSTTADPAEALRSIADALGRSRRRQASLVVLLTDCHEWLPDAGESACADALDALAQRDTAPGVGVVGVTERPSSVDSRFRRNCDWIAAHRVSWREHVDAVARILGRQYDDALEGLDDGEAFLDGPWTSAVQRVRFEGVDQHPNATRNRSRDEQHDRQRQQSSQRRTPEPATGTAAGIADLSDELLALRDRIEDLEATIDERNDVETIAGDLADAIAERLDDGDVASTDAPSRTQESESVELVETDTSSSQSGSSEDANDGDDSGGFGDVFDAFDAAGSASTGASGTSASSTGQTTRASRSESSTDTSPSGTSTSSNSQNGSNDSGGMSFEPANFAFDEGVTGGETSPDGIEPSRTRRRSGERRVPRYVRDLVRTVEEMDPTTRQMLAHYVDRGADTPMNAHFSAGGSDDRTSAYAHNRQLRTMGFVDHVGRGHYAPTIPEKVREEADSGLSDEAVKKATEHIRRALP